MRFQVPQNLDVADTVIFGLSFMQMLYLGGAGGFFIFLVFFAGGLIPALVIGGPVIGLAALLSFFSFNNRPFSVLLFSVVRFFTRKKMFVWKKEGNEVFVERQVRQDDTVAADVREGSERMKDLNADLMFDDDIPSSDADLDVAL